MNEVKIGELPPDIIKIDNKIQKAYNIIATKIYEIDELLNTINRWESDNSERLTDEWND